MSRVPISISISGLEETMRRWINWHVSKIDAGKATIGLGPKLELERKIISSRHVNKQPLSISEGRLCGQYDGVAVEKSGRGHPVAFLKLFSRCHVHLVENFTILHCVLYPSVKCTHSNPNYVLVIRSSFYLLGDACLHPRWMTEQTS